ncbi:MAG: BREX-1 system adenine-specific DNA-methyltransferase PglX, partial [Gammaproteobacteria bacterium]
FCALRYMDVNLYNRIGVVSPTEGQVQPEILAEAKAGHIDDAVVTGEKREQIFKLLNGSTPSRDPQTEAYRALIVAVCNDYHRLMPYLFERIDDYTELLMPDDLLSENSILAHTREAVAPEDGESVEVIGWLYQFYISEKKDQVFEGLKKNKKITPENIPAATQLFTPHWIVRYLVENSLGRLWMLNNPNSQIVERMVYYIKPVEDEADYLVINSPEELKICDPACGSGHMLTYAYDLLYAIYQDSGYEDADIPEKILSNNLYGIEIDERAAELSAFALSMKAIKGNPFDDSNNRRRFFKNPIEPNICKLEKIQFSDDELDSYIEFVGRDLFTQDLRATLKDFEEADNFGSLIRPSLASVGDALASLQAKDVSGQLFLAEIHKRVLKVLQQADYLRPKYHVVIANPPYMGGKGMNGRLGAWAKENYPNSKSDLFAIFIERNLELAVSAGAVAMITMQSWMFLSSFEKLRARILGRHTIVSMAHLGTRAFDSIGGEVVSTTAFVLENQHKPTYKGAYLRLVDGKSEAEKIALLEKAIQ